MAVKIQYGPKASGQWRDGKTHPHDGRYVFTIVSDDTGEVFFPTVSRYAKVAEQVGKWAWETVADTYDELNTLVWWDGLENPDPNGIGMALLSFNDDGMKWETKAWQMEYAAACQPASVGVKLTAQADLALADLTKQGGVLPPEQVEQFAKAFNGPGVTSKEKSFAQAKAIVEKSFGKADALFIKPETFAQAKGPLTGLSFNDLAVICKGIEHESSIQDGKDPAHSLYLWQGTKYAKKDVLSDFAELTKPLPGGKSIQFVHDSVVIKSADLSLTNELAGPKAVDVPKGEKLLEYKVIGPAFVMNGIAYGKGDSAWLSPAVADSYVSNGTLDPVAYKNPVLQDYKVVKPFTWEGNNYKPGYVVGAESLGVALTEFLDDGFIAEIDYGTTAAVIAATKPPPVPPAKYKVMKGFAQGMYEFKVGDHIPPDALSTSQISELLAHGNIAPIKPVEPTMAELMAKDGVPAVNFTTVLDNPNAGALCKPPTLTVMGKVSIDSWVIGDGFVQPTELLMVTLRMQSGWSPNTSVRKLEITHPDPLTNPGLYRFRGERQIGYDNWQAFDKTCTVKGPGMFTKEGGPWGALKLNKPEPHVAQEIGGLVVESYATTVPALTKHPYTHKGVLTDYRAEGLREKLKLPHLTRVRNVYVQTSMITGDFNAVRITGQYRWVGKPVDGENNVVWKAFDVIV